MEERSSKNFFMPVTRSKRTASSGSSRRPRAAARKDDRRGSPSPRRPLQPPQPLTGVPKANGRPAFPPPSSEPGGAETLPAAARDDHNDEEAAAQWASARRNARTSRQDDGRDGLLPALARCLRRMRKELVTIHDVDVFLQFNRFIRRGYRPSRLTPTEAFASIFLYVHNETVNILTHVFFAAVFVYLMLWPPIPPLFAAVYGTVSEADLPGSAAAAGEPGEAAGFWPPPAAPSAASNSPLFDSLGRRRAQGDAAPPTQEPPPRAHMVDPAATVAGSRASAFVPFRSQPRHLSRGQRSFDGGSQEAVHARGETGASVREEVGALRAMGAMPSRLMRTVVDAFDVFPGNQRRSQNRLRAAEVPAAAADVSLDPLYQVFAPVSLSFFCTFLLSTVYHTFMPCCSTRRGYQQLLQCDVLGVLTSISGSVYVYLVRGNPCVAPSVLTAAVAIMTVSSVCTLYALILAPLNVSVSAVLSAVLWALADFAAAVVLSVWEWLCGTRLRPPHSPHARHSADGDDDVLLHVLLRARRRFRRRVHVVRLWLRGGAVEGEEHGGPSTDYAQRGPHQQGTDVVPDLMRAPRRRADRGEDVSAGHGLAATAAEGVPPASVNAPPMMPAHHRAAIASIHCTLHFVCYLLIIVPKRTGSGTGWLDLIQLLPWSSHESDSPRSEAPSGYTQGAYYHGMSYLWLLLGGLLNATRQPERLVWAMTRRARAFERRRLELVGEAAVEEARARERLHAGGGEGARGGRRRPGLGHGQGGSGGERAGRAATRPPTGATAADGGMDGEDDSFPLTTVKSVLLTAFPFLPQDWSWASVQEHMFVWWPAAFCYGFTKFILSNRELDFVGNSHNLWHVMTGMSALCALIGAYYDVVEWELMAPQC